VVSDGGTIKHIKYLIRFGFRENNEGLFVKQL